MRSVALLACILSISALACSAPTGVVPDAGLGDGGTVDARVPAGDGGVPPGLVVERWGARVRAPVLALSRTDRTLWMGMSVVEDPSDASEPIHGGLVRLDLDSGAVRVYDDELPTVDVPGGGSMRLPVGGVVMDGDRAIAVTPAGLITIEGDEVSLHALARPDGEPLEPTRMVLDRPAIGDARLWVSTQLGLVLVDPDTLRVRSSSLPVGGPTGALAVDPATRDVYIADLAQSAIVRVQYAPIDTGPILSTWLRLGANGVTPGTPGDLAWSEQLHAVLVAVASHDPANGGVISWNGTDVRTLVREGQLSLAAHGDQVPFGAQSLVLDEADDILIVGGHLRPGGISGPTVGGGLVWLDLSTVGADPQVFGADVHESDLAGDHVVALAYDPVTNRTFASLRLPCDEVRLGNVGVDVVSFDDGALRVGTATLSGVRDLALHEGELWAAVRDDVPSLACEGVGSQGGLFAVHGARGGVAPRMVATRGEGNLSVWRPARIAPNAIALRDATHRIVASYRDSLFVGGDDGLLVNPAVELGVNLRTHAAVWVDDDTFWLSGPAVHDFTDGVDLDDIGPRGAVRVELDARGSVASRQRYVRGARYPEDAITTGLPSSNVTAVVPSPTGITYLVSGVERITTLPYDRLEGPAFSPDGSLRRGGVSSIAADGTLTVLDDGEQVPDGRAAVLDHEGVLWVLDAERGLLRLDGDVFVAAPIEGLDVPDGSIPTGLFADDGWMVATYSSGAALRLGDTTAWIDGAGWAWTAIERAPGVLLIGADEGMLRVRRETAEDPGERALVPGELPPFGPVPVPR